MTEREAIDRAKRAGCYKDGRCRAFGLPTPKGATCLRCQTRPKVREALRRTGERTRGEPCPIYDPRPPHEIPGAGGVQLVIAWSNVRGPRACPVCGERQHMRPGVAVELRSTAERVCDSCATKYAPRLAALLAAAPGAAMIN